MCVAYQNPHIRNTKSQFSVDFSPHNEAYKELYDVSFWTYTCKRGIWQVVRSQIHTRGRSKVLIIIICEQKGQLHAFHFCLKHL